MRRSIDTSNTWGKSYKARSVAVSKCKLEGNGHMPSSKHMSNIEMSSITLRDIPGYLPSRDDKNKNSY